MTASLTSLISLGLLYVLGSGFCSLRSLESLITSAFEGKAFPGSEAPVLSHSSMSNCGMVYKDSDLEELEG